MGTVFVLLVWACYAMACALYVGYAVTKKEPAALAGRVALWSGIILHVVSFAVGLYANRLGTGQPLYTPWTTWYQSLSFFALIIAVEYTVVQWREHTPILGAFVTPLVLLVMTAGLSSVLGSPVAKEPPVLKSVWPVVHVPLIFAAYGAFGNAFAVGLAFLIQERQLKSKRPGHLAFRLPPLDDLDNLIFRIILFGWPALALGLVLGTQWANQVWGRYWGWDPKETWALITVLVYSAYLYLRLFAGWRGRKTAYLSLAGFALVLFTYIGVGHISDLHGFLSGGEH